MKKTLFDKIEAKFESLGEVLKNKGNKSQLIRDGISSLVVNFVNKAVVLLTGIMLVRFLGKVQYGIYSYILSLIFVLIIPAEYGLSNLLVRETARGLTKDEPGDVNGIWRWSFRITLFFSLILLIISIVASILFSDQFSKLELQTFYWGLALIPLHSFVHIISAMLRGMKHIILGQLPDLVVIPGIFALAILAFYLISPSWLSTSGIMALRSITTLVALLLCVYLFIKKAPVKILKATPKGDQKVWFKSAIPLGLSSGLNMVKTRVTIILIGFFVTAGDIGTFQVAISAAAIAGLVLQAINSILAPQFASLYAKREMKNLQKLVSFSALLILFFNLLATTIFVIWGKALLKFAFGPDLVEAYGATLYLLVGQLINSLVGPVAFLLNMTGYEKDVMSVVTLSSIINVILTLILTPFWGIIGAAISNSISLIVAQFVMFRLVKQKLGIVSHVFGKSF